MRVKNIFKPGEVIPEIQDEVLVKERYKYWRLRIFSGMYVGYIFYYFTRKSFAFAMPAMVAELGFDKSDLGLVGSILAITYGISKFVSGVMADRSNPRFVMAIGLFLTGVFNILVGSSSTILFFAIFWGLNGWFQGWGWPPCARLLTHWYSQKERGTWWGVWNTSHGIGGALIPLLVAYCAQQWSWRYALYVPGAICILVSFYIMNRLRDTPQSLGLPPIEKFRNDYSAQKHVERDLSVKEILLEYVFKNKYIWILALSYFFVYVIRQGINDWSVLFLAETRGYSIMTAGACVCWFEIGGMCGSLIAGWASDRIFQGKRAPINILFSVGVFGGLAAFWCATGASPLIDSLLMFVIGFFIFGPQMLIGMAAVELSHKKAAASANGFTGCWSYLGAAVAGYPLSKIAQDFGWQAFFITLGFCALAIALLLLPLWSAKTNPQYATEQ